MRNCRRARVAFISSLNGGVGTFTVGLACGLSKYLEQVDLYLFSGYKHIPIPELPRNVAIITNQKNRALFLIKLLFPAGRLKNYDIIHLNYASFFLPVYAVKKLWNVPYLLTSHNFPAPEMEKFPGKLYNIFESVCLKFSSENADSHITISDYAKRVLQERYKVSPEAIIHHGIDTENFKFNEMKREALRKSLGIKDTDFLILFVGILYEHKSVITLVNALPYVLKDNHDVKLLIVGRGDQYNEITRRIKELKIEELVRIKDYVEDINAYYSAADLFVLPSTNEGFGFVLLEAMACGLPIVASNCSSCPEVIGDAGLLFEPRNSQDLADKIIELINNKELYRKLKEKALERVKQFTWERATEQYYEIYKKVLEEEK